MWTCQGLKVNKEDHLKETGMEESVLKDVFIARNKVIGSSNVRNFWIAVVIIMMDIVIVAEEDLIEMLAIETIFKKEIKDQQIDSAQIQSLWGKGSILTTNHMEPVKMIDHLLVQCHHHPQSHLIVINPNKDIKKKTEKIIKETYPVLNQDHHPTVKVLKAPEVLHQDLLSKKERKNKRNKENKGKRKMLIKINQIKNNHATKKENQVDQRIKKIKRTQRELPLPYHPHLVPNHNLSKNRKIIN